jgi:hypothetical protein
MSSNTVVVHELVYPVLYQSSIVLHPFGIRASIDSNTLLLLPSSVVTIPCSTMSDSSDTQAAAAFVPPSAGLLPRHRSTLTTRKEEVKIPSQDSIDLFSTDCETSSVLKFGVQFNHTVLSVPRNC